MPSFRSREVTVAVTGLALVVALSATVTILSPPASEGLPSGSSFSHETDGSGAAYQTLEKLGYRVTRSFEPISSLSVDPSSTILILADPREPASNADRRALQAMLSAGATVLATGCAGTTFFSEGTGGLPSRVAETQSFRALLPSPLTAGAPQIVMHPDCPGLLPAARYAALYGRDEASAVVRFQRPGRGLAVWWAGNTPLSNAAIDTPGHLELLLNITGGVGKTILWDEFYHGQRRSLYSYARHTPLPWLAAQAMLIAAVAAAMFVRRRAPVLDRRVESRASPLEFVDTMAGLYARAGTAGEAVAVARARFRRLLLAATGLATNVGDERLAAAAAARLRLDPQVITSALADAGPDAATIKAAEALPIVRRLQQLAAGFDHAGD